MNDYTQGMSSTTDELSPIKNVLLMEKFNHLFNDWINLYNDIQFLKIYLHGESKIRASNYSSLTQLTIKKDIENLSGKINNIGFRLVQNFFNDRKKDETLLNKPKKEITKELLKIINRIPEKNSFWGSLYKLEQDMIDTIHFINELKELIKQELEGSSISTIKPRVTFEETHYGHRRVIEASETVITYLLSKLNLNVLENNDHLKSKYIGIKSYSYAVRPFFRFFFDIPRAKAFNLRTWMILCHECAHVLLEREGYPEKIQYISRAIKASRLIGEEIDLESWINEISCDAIAFKMVGPIYFYTLLSRYLLPISLNPEPFPKSNAIGGEYRLFYHDINDPFHPPISFRLKIMLENIIDDKESFEEVKAFLVQIRQLFDKMKKSTLQLNNPFAIFKEQGKDLLTLLQQIEKEEIKHIQQKIDEIRKTFEKEKSQEPKPPKFRESMEEVIEVNAQFGQGSGQGILIEYEEEHEDIEDEIQLVMEDIKTLEIASTQENVLDDNYRLYTQDLNLAKLWLIRRYLMVRSLEDILASVYRLIYSGELLEDINFPEFNLLETIEERDRKIKEKKRVPSFFTEFDPNYCYQILKRIEDTKTTNKALIFTKKDVPYLLIIPWMIDLNHGQVMKIIDSISKINLSNFEKES